MHTITPPPQVVVVPPQAENPQFEAPAQRIWQDAPVKQEVAQLDAFSQSISQSAPLVQALAIALAADRTSTLHTAPSLQSKLCRLAIPAPPTAHWVFAPVQVARHSPWQVRAQEDPAEHTQAAGSDEQLNEMVG